MTDHSGFRVCAERCDQCLFSKDRIVSGERMAEILADCRATERHFICHKHTDVCCRGFFETQPLPWYARWAKGIGRIVLVPNPKETPRA